MSGLKQRANDRDGAPDGCRGVTLRVAGVSRPATGLAQIAQIAEIAQISKASMKWATGRSRDVPALIAQIAEIILRSSGPAINMSGGAGRPASGWVMAHPARLPRRPERTAPHAIPIASPECPACLPRAPRCTACARSTGPASPVSCDPRATPGPALGG